MLDYSKASPPNKFAVLSKQSFIIGLLLFTFFLIITRLFFCNQTLGLDEAEQMVFAQTLSAGYPAQPPLYTWIQHFIFEILGFNLFSLALFKYLCLAGAIYVYYSICCLYCHDDLLTYCATFSWMLIPSISYDLLPHRTHVILALLASNLTWYWFIKPQKTRHITWYAILGFIITIGLLSKFNYILFLSFFLLILISIAEYRRIIFNSRILITISIALLLSSPYWLWLFSNASLGLNAAYKLRLPGKTQLNGLLSLLGTCLFFATPLIVMRFVFPSSSSASYSDRRTEISSFASANLLLRRYHITVLPFLFSFVLLVGIYNFKPHWILPLLFLSPVLIFSLLSQKVYAKKTLKKYLSLCVVVQLFLISVWIARTPALARFPLDSLIQAIKDDNQSIDSLASDSHWLLGSLMWRLSVHQGTFIHPLKPVSFPKGNVLLVWEGENNMLYNLTKTEIKQLKDNKVLTNRSYTHSYRVFHQDSHIPSERLPSERSISISK